VNNGATEYKNRHLGETCAILLNGESIKQFSPGDWSHPVIGANRSWLSVNGFPGVRSDYHCVIDFAQVEALAEAGVELGVLFVGIADKTARSLDNTGRKRALYGVVKAERIVELYGHEGRRDPHFSADFAEPFWLPNVALFSLQLAALLGFHRIEIWGLDLDGPKFWDERRVMPEPIRGIQNRQLNFAAPILKERDICVINRNAHSLCGAFPKKEKSHGGNASG
jgi:hypothetical protein